MGSPRRTTLPGSAIQASVPPTSLEIRASLRLTTVPVADRLAATVSARAVDTTTGTGGGASAACQRLPIVRQRDENGGFHTASMGCGGLRHGLRPRLSR